MPTVNRCRGCGLGQLGKTAATWAGVNSFDDSPYRPPITLRQRALPALGQRRDHVLVERLAAGARLLRAVQHGDFLDRLGQRGQQGLAVEGPEQPHLDQADLLALWPPGSRPSLPPRRRRNP